MIIKNLNTPEVHPVSVEEVKLFLKLPHEDNAIVFLQIQGAMHFIERSCNLRFLKQQCCIESEISAMDKHFHLLRQDISSQEDILLSIPLGPIMEIVDLKINGLPVHGNIIGSNVISVPYAPYKGALVRLVGEFGFGQSPGVIPQDLRLALLLKIASFYHENKSIEEQLKKLLETYKRYDL